jgi:hypothetical protein
MTVRFDMPAVLIDDRAYRGGYALASSTAAAQRALQKRWLALLADARATIGPDQAI